jgi:hypothetical protein
MSFFSFLPLEVRHRVYCFLAQPGEAVIVQSRQGSSKVNIKIAIPLLLVNKKFSAEILYAISPLLALDVDVRSTYAGVDDFIGATPRWILAHLSKLSLHTCILQRQRHGFNWPSKHEETLVLEQLRDLLCELDLSMLRILKMTVDLHKSWAHTILFQRLSCMLDIGCAQVINYQDKWNGFECKSFRSEIRNKEKPLTLHITVRCPNGI